MGLCVVQRLGLHVAYKTKGQSMGACVVSVLRVTAPVTQTAAVDGWAHLSSIPEEGQLH